MELGFEPTAHQLQDEFIPAPEYKHMPHFVFHYQLEKKQVVEFPTTLFLLRVFVLLFQIISGGCIEVCDGKVTKCGKSSSTRLQFYKMLYFLHKGTNGS